MRLDKPDERPESVSGEPPRSEPPQYALLHTPIVRLLEMRDALIRDDVAEAYHLLYSLAEPTFTEREPWRRWEELAGSRPSAPSREGLCDDCGNEYPTPWFVSNDIWNQVVELSADPKNFLCMHCFVKRADKVIRCTGWEIVPENRPSAPAPRGKDRTMPETLAERIAEEWRGEWMKSTCGPKQAINAAIRDFAGEVAAQIRAGKEPQELADGNDEAYNEGIEKSAQIVERAAGGEG